MTTATIYHGRVHVRFAHSETRYRLHEPPRRGDFIGDRYFTGTRWARLTAQRLKLARKLAGDRP